MSFYNNLGRKKNLETILASGEADGHGHSLSKNLTFRDLTSFGIAAIIGAGIFSTIGKASAGGGPAVIFLFIFTALACSCAGFAYAEFASMAPVSGSAYTYSYIAFGELFAWVIGWALIAEYAIGNITVAISWSDYFTSLLNRLSDSWDVPHWMTMDYFTAKNSYTAIDQLLSGGATLDQLKGVSDHVNTLPGYLAWLSAPQIFGFHLILDLPALSIVFLITWLVYRGIEESRKASNAMVVLKIAVVILVIVVGAFWVNTDNWHPFAPNGVSGILSGVSSVFFAYIGFDAISTTAEECKDPQRDLPRGMMASIIICTVLYVLIALVITGMVSYKELNVGDPLAYVFEKFEALHWLSGVVALSAVFAMASVLLVFQLGQPRIWMTMSRDGLLPKSFSKIHPRFKTPSFATIVTGFLVGMPIFFVDLTFVTDICSLGTLFAFVLVCAGVLRLQNHPEAMKKKFKTPYLNAKYLMGLGVIVSFVACWYYSPTNFENFFKLRQCKPATELTTQFNANQIQPKLQALPSYQADKTTLEILELKEPEAYRDVCKQLGPEAYNSGWPVLKQQIPMFVFILICILLSYFAFKHNYSTIPLLGMISCLYMMTQLGFQNWVLFGVWLIIGLVVYLGYGYRNSKLAR